MRTALFARSRRRRRGALLIAALPSVLMFLGVTVGSLTLTGCHKEQVVVAGSGDDEDDPKYQEYKRQIDKKLQEVDKDPRLSPDQKAQVKHDLLADGLKQGKKKN